MGFQVSVVLLQLTFVCLYKCIYVHLTQVYEFLLG